MIIEKGEYKPNPEKMRLMLGLKGIGAQLSNMEHPKISNLNELLEPFGFEVVKIKK